MKNQKFYYGTFVGLFLSFYCNIVIEIWPYWAVLLVGAIGLTLLRQVTRFLKN